MECERKTVSGACKHDIAQLRGEPKMGVRRASADGRVHFINNVTKHGKSVGRRELELYDQPVDFGDIKEHRDALARGMDNVEKMELAAGCRHNKRR